MTDGEWDNCTDPLAMLEFLRGNPTGEDSVTWWNNRWQIDEPSKGHDRKFRLFACSCCRRIWDRIPEKCNQDAVVAVEDFLDGHIPGPVLRDALAASSTVEWKEDGSGRRTEPGYWVVKYLGRGFYKMTAAASALLISSQTVFLTDPAYAREATEAFDSCFYTNGGVFFRPFQWPLPVPATVGDERATQANLLRCIFANPLRRPEAAIEPAWLAWNDSLVPRLAQAAYDDRQLPAGELTGDRLLVLADALEEAGCTDAELLAHLRSPGPHVRGRRPVDLVLGRG